MPREPVESTTETTAQAADRLDLRKGEPQAFEEFLSGLSGGAGEAVEAPLKSSEKELVRELVQALRTIRYGSIVLVIHEGHVVEVNKTVKIRTSRSSKKE
jgi:hypothetical protein